MKRADYPVPGSLPEQLAAPLLILLYVYAASAKLLAFNVFRRQLAHQPFPPSVVPVLHWLLPAAELLAAVLLAFAVTRRTGLLLSAVMLALFSGYVALALLHFWERYPCSCGGILGRLPWGWHLALNLCFLGLNLAALRRHDARPPG